MLRYKKNSWETKSLTCIGLERIANLFPRLWESRKSQCVPKWRKLGIVVNLARSVQPTKITSKAYQQLIQKVRKNSEQHLNNCRPQFNIKVNLTFAEEHPDYPQDFCKKNIPWTDEKRWILDGFSSVPWEVRTHVQILQMLDCSYSCQDVKFRGQ